MAGPVRPKRTAAANNGALKTTQGAAMFSRRSFGIPHVASMSAVAIIAAVIAGCGPDQPKPGTVLDEAMRANRSAASMPAAGEDYFHNMDGALPLSPEEVQGRNMWLVWTGGNDRLWDRMTVESVGTFDLLKTVSSHRAVGYGRHNRWNYLGLVNEPCFAEATAPDPDRFGLWLDVRDPGCATDPFADDQKYPGVKLGARGSTVRVGSYYGEPTGVVGLRLFPNPDFDENARKKWNAEKYYNDPAYYMSKD